MLRATAQHTCFALTLLAATAAGAAEQTSSSANEQGQPADADADEESKSYNFGLGIAGFTQQQAYTDIDRFNTAIPLIYFENDWVQLFGPWLDIKFPGLEWGEEGEEGYEYEFSSGIRTQLFGFHGYESDDAPILNGMEDRENGIFAGPFAKWSNPVVDVTAEWMLDTSGNSNGQRVTLGLERSFPAGQKLMFTPSITGTWLDEKYTNYYYGVSSVEARPGRPAYDAQSTVITDISLRTDYMFNQHHSVFGMLQYTALGNEIVDSPLTDRSSETMILFGYLYLF